MTLTEINNLKIEDYFYQLTIRLLPKLKPTDIKIIPNAKGLVTYSSITLPSNVKKPTLKKYKAEFTKFKNELIAQEKARLAEEARIKDITDRFNAIENPHQMAMNINKYQPNMGVFLQEIIKNNDIATLEALEAEHAKYQKQKTLEQRKKKLDELRKLRDVKLKEVDVMINEITLGVRTNKQAVIDYRQALLDITKPYIKVNGDPKASVDSLDLSTFKWPTKPL